MVYSISVLVVATAAGTELAVVAEVCLYQLGIGSAKDKKGNLYVGIVLLDNSNPVPEGITISDVLSENIG